MCRIGIEWTDRRTVQNALTTTHQIGIKHTRSYAYAFVPLKKQTENESLAYIFQYNKKNEHTVKLMDLLFHTTRGTQMMINSMAFQTVLTTFPDSAITCFFTVYKNVVILVLLPLGVFQNYCLYGCLCRLLKYRATAQDCSLTCLLLAHERFFSTVYTLNFCCDLQKKRFKQTKMR